MGFHLIFIGALPELCSWHF